MNSKQQRLDDLLAVLERASQRATYAAIGKIVGLPAQSVMQGRAKNTRNSWVVSKRTLLPTGYAKHECHPLLQSRAEVLDSEQSLAVWLRENPR